MVCTCRSAAPDKACSAARDEVLSMDGHLVTWSPVLALRLNMPPARRGRPLRADGSAGWLARSSPVVFSCRSAAPDKAFPQMVTWSPGHPVGRRRNPRCIPRVLSTSTQRAPLRAGGSVGWLPRSRSAVLSCKSAAPDKACSAARDKALSMDGHPVTWSAADTTRCRLWPYA